jgi:hypothetical protein
VHVYAASDLHGELPDFPADADLIILAGDICPDFRAPRDTPQYWSAQAHWLNTDFRKWLLSRPRGSEVYGIWGNHDFVGEHRDFIPDNLPWKLLQDEAASLTLWNGRSDPEHTIRVYGTPWVPGLPRWAFYASETQLRARSEKAIPPFLDILISHGPPHGAGDYIPGGTEKQVSKYGNLHGIHVGDVWLRDLTLGHDAPKNLICGHIHESRGVHVSGNTTVYNVAAVDELYDLHPNPWTRIHL